MPQVRKNVPVVGVYAALRADAVRFVENWKGWSRCPDVVVTEGGLERLAHHAVEPVLRKHFLPPSEFAKFYSAAPEFVDAFQAEMVKRWSRYGTPSAALYQFLAMTVTVAGGRTIWERGLQDKDLVAAFKARQPRQPCTVAMVTKTRKRLAARIKKGIELGPERRAWQGGKRIPVKVTVMVNERATEEQLAKKKGNPQR